MAEDGELHGWHPDPFGRFEERYFVYGEPSQLVRSAGVDHKDQHPLKVEHAIARRRSQAIIAGVVVLVVVLASVMVAHLVSSGRPFRQARKFRTTKTLPKPATKTGQNRRVNLTFRTVSCESQNTHPADHPPTGLIPGPVMPKTVAHSVGATASEWLSLFGDGWAHSKYSDQLAVLAPVAWKCLGSVYEDGAGVLDIYPPAAASHFTWTKTSLPSANAYTGPLVSLQIDWLGHRTAAPLVCPWLSDPEFTRLAEQINLATSRINSTHPLPGATQTISCTPPAGAHVMHISTDISRMTYSDGSLGAATSTGVPYTGTVTLFQCRDLSARACRTIVKDYVTRVRAIPVSTLAPATTVPVTPHVTTATPPVSVAPTATSPQPSLPPITATPARMWATSSGAT